MSNSTKYLAKSALRQAKNYAKGYSDIQIKVRESTSNDAWGPSGTLMAEIANATFNHKDFIEIMEMLDKRLNDHGKNWRHVFKSLTLLDYLLHCGSENVISYARDNLYVIKTLKEFQYIDEDGKDQGANVRQKSKEITSLLADEARLREQRQSRMAMRDRMTGRMAGGFDDNVGGYHSGGYSTASPTSDYPSGGAAAAASLNRPTDGHYDEDYMMRKALEESRKTALEEERRRVDVEKSEHDLQKALEISQQEHQLQAKDQNSNIDFFKSLDHTPVAIPQQHQQPLFDPFAMPQQQVQPAAFDPFAIPSQPQFQQQPNPFVLQHQQHQHHIQQQTVPNPFGTMTAITAVQSSSTMATGSVGLPIGFRSDNPNARVAEIARNSEQIDPFAGIAASSSNGSASNLANTNPFGGAVQSAPLVPTSFTPLVPQQSFQSPQFPPTTNNNNNNNALMSGLPSQLVSLNPSSLAPASSTPATQQNASPFAGLMKAQQSPTAGMPGLNKPANTNKNPFSTTANNSVVGAGGPTLNNMNKSNNGSGQFGSNPMMAGGNMGMPGVGIGAPGMNMGMGMHNMGMVGGNTSMGSMTSTPGFSAANSMNGSFGGAQNPNMMNRGGPFPPTGAPQQQMGGMNGMNGMNMGMGMNGNAMPFGTTQQQQQQQQQQGQFF